MAALARRVVARNQAVTRKAGIHFDVSAVAAVPDRDHYRPLFAPWTKPEWEEKLGGRALRTLVTFDRRYILYNALAQALRAVPGDLANATFSFTQSFRKGTLNSNAPVSTPTHRGALVFSWPGPSGPVPSLTVVQPFRYSYQPQRIAHGTRLRFYLARPYPVGSPTRALITVTAGGKSTVVFDETVPLASPTRILWTAREVDLSRFAPHAVVLTFGAIATSDPSAAWVAFGYHSLVISKR